MISAEQTKRLIDIALEHGKGKASGVEVQVMASDYATSRFANNGMTQNQAPNQVSVSVRVIVDGRQARLSADRIAEADIKKLVDDAVAVAKLLDKDSEVLPVFSVNGSDKSIDRYDKKTAEITPDRRAEAVKTIVDVAKSKKIISAGTVSSGSNVFALGNSTGLFRHYQGTQAGCSITMNNDGATGWVKLESPEFADLDVASMANCAAEKAIASANPVEIDPGHYTVIMEPSATLDFMGYLWGDFAGTSYKDKLSCLLDKLGQKVFGDNITVFDDAYHPLQWGEQFDGEGVARKKVTLIEKGVAKNLVYGRRAAKHFDVDATGHGLMEPNSEGEFPQNIIVEGGNTTLAEMVAGTERGILLTRVWYVREVDPTKKIITGMTRDGTFLIEGGKITNGVKNLRFNESIIDVLNRVEALGPSVRTAGEEANPSIVPPMKIANFKFDSTTRF